MGGVIWAASSGGEGDQGQSTPTTTVDPAVVNSDTKKIEDLISYINAAYASDTGAGIRASAATNYDVFAEGITVDDCMKTLRRRLRELSTSRFAVTLREGSAKPASPRMANRLEDINGRLYTVKLDVTITLPNRPEPVPVTAPATYVVVSDGTAKRVEGCEPQQGPRGGGATTTTGTTSA